VDRLLTGVLRRLVRAYQIFLSPAFVGQCRFEPSCSHFAAEALDRHGWQGGSALALRRLLRCHPWGGRGGFDPVP
jgi:putative membrane protein insertion efficiency factor